MHIVYYLDVFCLINFMADFYGLLVTGYLLKQEIKWSRLIGGAIFGTGMLLPFIMYPENLMGWTGIFWWIGISMGAVWIAYGRKGGLLRKWALTTTVLILMGGIINSLQSKWNMTILTIGSWLLFFLGSAGAVLLLAHGMKEILHKRNTVCLIDVYYGKRKKRGLVLLDTGNKLRDGLFGKSVVILSDHFLFPILTMEEQILIQKYKETKKIDYTDLIRLKTQKRACFHEIAYQSVGNPSGKMICFLADRIILPEEHVCLEKQPVAIGMDDLFVQKEYDGLMFLNGIN